MPRITGRNKFCLDNPIQNLSDLIIYVCKILNCDYKRKDNKYRFSIPSLSANLVREIKDETTDEKICIRKKWDNSIEEKITYTSKFIDPKVYEEREKEYLRSAPAGVESYKEHLETPGFDRYLDLDSYIESIQFVQVPQCTIEYETNDVGRGLQTMVSLKIDQSNPEDDEDENPFYAIYRSMMVKGDYLLKAQLGSDISKWRKYLRAGKAKIVLPYRKKIENVFPPWIIGYILVDLCKYFAR